MSITPIFHPANGGLKASSRETTYPDHESWFWLHNWRTNRGGYGFSGRPPFNGGTVTSSVNIRDWANNALTTGNGGVYHVLPRNIATQPIFAYIVNKGFHKQTGTGSFSQLNGYVEVTQPAATGITQRCLLIADAYNFTTAFAALGDTFEVEIDGATTFQWRVNGGAWTSLVPIAATVTVGTYYALYFLTTSGFTVGENWVWRRTDSLLETSSTAAGPPGRIARSGNDYFFVGYGNLLARAYFGRSGATNGEFVTRSLGYRRCFGQHLIVFENHLFVAGFSETYTGLAAAALTMSWTDLNDLDNFYATDVNEADSYTITGLSPSAFVEEGITGFAIWGGALYTFTQTSVHRTVYVGLPLVMVTQKITDQLGCISHGGVVTTANGIYFPGADGFYRFNGSSFQNISPKITNLNSGILTGFPTTIPALLDTVTNGGVGSYNPYTGEIYWSLNANGTRLWMIFDEVTQLWSTESVPTDTTVTGRHQIFNMSAAGQVSQVLSSSDGFYRTVGSTPINTEDQVIITNVFRHSPDMGRVLEVQDIWVDVKIPSGCTFTGFYQTADVTSAVHLTTGWTSLGTFDTTTRRFPEVRIPFKQIAYKFVLTRATSSEPTSVFNGFIEYIYGLPDPAAK